MRLLSGHSLTPERRVPAEEMSLQLNERESTAAMTPVDMTGISINSWMQDDTEPGRGIVWRVKSISQAYGTNTPKVQLEHMISALKDVLLFGEIKPKDITGNAKATSCTAEQAVRYILSHQSDWVLGAFGYNVTNPYKFDGDSLYDALETVSNTLEDAWWSYDFSVYPFRLNITRKSAEVGTVLRPSRNVTAITKNIDRSGMYTRFYPTGKDDLTLPEKYVERNVNLYGIVSKVETDATMDTAEELRAWANERLKKHAEPTVTIDVEGLELAEATGQPLDKLQLGQKCLIPMSEFGAEILETITQLSYSDKIRQKEVVKVTLANNRTDVTRIISDAIKSNKKGTRVSTKTNKEDHAWFEDTNNHVAMCAEGIVGVDAQGNPNWTRLSQIIVDENGIHNTVQSVQNGLVIANTAIEQNENAIALEAQRRTEENAQLSGRITVEAGKISQVVQAVGKDGEVTAASIVLAINEASESEARIDANKVYIGNQKSTTVINGKLSASDVTAEFLKAKMADITGQLIVRANVQSLGFMGDDFSVVNTLTIDPDGLFGVGDGCSISGSDGVHHNFDDIIVSASVNGNTLTLTPLVGNPINFSKAVATLSGDWSGSYQAGKKYVVTSSEGVTDESPIVNAMAKYGAASRDQSNNLIQRVLVSDSDGNAIYLGSVDVTNIYDDGYDTGYAYNLPNGISVSGLSNAGTVRPTNATEISSHSPASIKQQFPNNYGYLLFTVSVHGQSKRYYFSFDTRS